MRMNGQALTEFAVMGGIALMALTFLIQIGLRMNYQQELEQDTFRRALAEARAEWNDDNSKDNESHSVQYYQLRNRELPDPGQGFAIMPKTLTQANATVLWGKWKTHLGDDLDSLPKIIVEVDNSGKAPDETGFRGENAYHAGNGNKNFSELRIGSYERRKEYRSEDLKLADKADPSKECAAYARDCAEHCGGDDDTCRKACNEKQENLCVGAPFIQSIRNELVSGGVIRQDNAGSSRQTVTRTRHLVTFNLRESKVPNEANRSIGSFLYSCNPLVLSQGAKHLEQRCP